MEADINELLRNSAFDGLEPERKQAFAALVERIKGKNQMEIMTELANFSKNPPNGRQFTKQEQSEMLGVFLSSLPEAESRKYKTMLSMLGLM